MRILAIDPGTTVSAWVVYDDGTIIDKGLQSNNDIVAKLYNYFQYNDMPSRNGPEKMFVEMVASYGMPVGKTVFETCVWVGRFIEAWGDEWEFVYRQDVKLHLCKTPRANDASVRQAILDRYGSERSIAIGTKNNPGPLYGVSKDIWAALGVAITAAETNLSTNVGESDGKYGASIDSRIANDRKEGNSN